MMLAVHSETDRQALVKLIRKWGGANSDALLTDNCHIFTVPGIEGFIGYKLVSSCAIVFGDPVCSPQDKPLLAKAFDEERQKKSEKSIYLVATQEFADFMVKNISAAAIEFGNTFVFDPQQNPAKKSGRQAVLLRKKVKHALKDGVVVGEYSGHDSALEMELENVAAEWLSKRRGPQIYLTQVSLFKDKYGRRWFYAAKNDQVIGLLVLDELESQRGWFISNVMMIGDVPSGLSELLITSSLEKLKEEGCRFVLAGPAPSKQLGTICGTGSIQPFLIRFLYSVARGIFHLDNFGTFWEKFQPQNKSCFLVFPHGNIQLSSLHALFKALNVGVLLHK